MLDGLLLGGRCWLCFVGGCGGEFGLCQFGVIFGCFGLDVLVFVEWIEVDCVEIQLVEEVCDLCLCLFVVVGDGECMVIGCVVWCCCGEDL